MRGEGGGGRLTSASGRCMDWMVLRSCSKRAIRSLCSAAVAMASVTWTCRSAQRPAEEDMAVRGGLVWPVLPLQPPVCELPKAPPLGQPARSGVLLGLRTHYAGTGRGPGQRFRRNGSPLALP